MDRSGFAINASPCVPSGKCGLKSFPEAITAVSPRTEVQTCIAHLPRYSMQFASWRERRGVAPALKRVYQADSAAAASERLEDFACGRWGQKYPMIAQSWRRNWEEAIQFFPFALEVRRILYTTSAIERLNAQVRKAVRIRGHFPAKRPRPSPSGWRCVGCRRAGKLPRFFGRLPRLSCDSVRGPLRGGGLKWLSYCSAE
jgi:putative transposase